MDYTKKRVLEILRNRAFCQRTAVGLYIYGSMVLPNLLIYIRSEEQGLGRLASILAMNANST